MTTALQSVAVTVLEDHVRHCVAAVAERNSEHLLAAVQRFSRTR